MRFPTAALPASGSKGVSHSKLLADWRPLAMTLKLREKASKGKR